jgi:hypothetical protein
LTVTHAGVDGYLAAERQQLDSQADFLDSDYSLQLKKAELIKKQDKPRIR